MKKMIREYPLISFFVLAYLLSWVCWVPLTFAEGVDQDLVFLIMLVGVLGPMLAGIIISRITKTSKVFWQSTLKWKVPLCWHLMALGLPLIVLFLILGIYQLFGVEATSLGAIHTADIDPWYMYPLILLFMIFVGGGLEEPGWRGFAQARMLTRFTPFSASIILGIIWTYWHTPLLFVPGSSQQGIELGWYTAGVTSLAVILTWLFISSKGSAFLAIIFHGGVNAINGWVPPFTISISGLEFSGFAVMEFIWIIVALVIILLNRKMFFERIPKKDYLSNTIGKTPI